MLNQMQNTEIKASFHEIQFSKWEISLRNPKILQCVSHEITISCTCAAKFLSNDPAIKLHIGGSTTTEKHFLQINQEFMIQFINL